MTWVWAAIGLWALVGLIGIIVRFREAGQRLDRMISWTSTPRDIEEGSGDE